jgi:hypothetical protein
MFIRIYLTAIFGVLLVSSVIAGDRTIPSPNDPGISLENPAAMESPISAMTGEEINRQVISGGGGRGTSTNYGLSCTVAQTATGSGVSTLYDLWHGFWWPVMGGECCTIPGDANGDGFCNVGDAVYIINYVFLYGPPPPCMEQGDANCDGMLNVGDAVYIVNYVFSGGPEPCCP